MWSGLLETFLQPGDFDRGNDVILRLVGRMHGRSIAGYNRGARSRDA